MTYNGFMQRLHFSVPASAAALTFIFHLVANPHYGFFRDELYFIICGFHPQWGYVDQPPLTPLLAAASQVFGHSLFLLRAVPAAFAGASVYVACLFALELGGGVFAMSLAALCTALCPVLAAFAQKAGPDMVGLLLWPLAALYLVRIVKGGDERAWLGVGAALGISAQSKYSVIYFGVAFLAGLLITPQRRVIASKWFAAGAMLAVLVALPSVIWQAVHGFPMWELLRAGQSGKNVTLGPIQYLIAEVVITNPVLALVWITGLVWTLLRPELRFLGYGYLLLIAAMIASHGKHYYPADVYPIFFSAGAVALQAVTEKARIARPFAALLAILAGLVSLPYSEPILSEPAFISFNMAVGPKIGMGVTVTEHLKQNWMTQDWADMHGWPQLAQAVARVYDALPDHDRKQAVAVTGNYGEASAIEFFSHVPVISGHNQYFLWGTRGYSGNVVIDVGGNCGASLHLFRQSRRAATFSAPYIMPYEDHMPIMVCRGIKKPLSTVWPGVKNYE
jgi:4-amino-4-deoxy-L-arabinose transferase-like glycosyltransferase